jgi:predicted O-methyltransferase YrrM
MVASSHASVVDDVHLAKLRKIYHRSTHTRFNYYTFLNRVVQERKPRIALEIGVEYGIGSAHMCAAAESYDGLVIGIDLKWHVVPSHQLQKRYNYIFLEDDSLDAFHSVEKCVDHYGKIGVVFQDSSHHYAISVEEWKLYSQLLDENAIWICDDIASDFFEAGVDEKSMVGYWDELPGAKKLYPDILHYGNTVGIMLI